MSTSTATQTNKRHHDEIILVVKRTHLFPQETWDGFKKIDFDQYLSIIQENKEFQPRSQMETDPNYKQIIPYLIFKHNNKYFLMQRKKGASEKRLQSKFSFGIGGHIRQEDLCAKSKDSIFDWARREFEEEIDYNGSFTIQPLGMINDDSNDVGKVHIGFVFLLDGDSCNIKVRSELQSGELMSLEECNLYADHMETWSQMVFNHLTKS